MKHLVRVAVAATTLAAALISSESFAAEGSSLRFEITVPAAVRSEPVTGRAYVMISRTNEQEPRLQIGRTGVPFFGRDIKKLAPGEPAVIDETDLGSPVPSLREIPPGDYYVQGFINIYSEFILARTLIRASEQFTLAVGLQLFVESEYAAKWGNLAAAAIIGAAPIVLTFLVAQKQIIGGLTSGAVKG